MLIDISKLESLGPDQPQAVLHQALLDTIKAFRTMEKWYHQEHRAKTILWQGISDIAQFQRSDSSSRDLDRVIQTAILTEAQL